MALSTANSRPEELLAGHITAEMLQQLRLAGLPASEAIAIARHLETCSQCRCLKHSIDFWSQFTIGQMDPDDERE